MTGLDKKVVMLTGAGGSAGSYLATTLLDEGVRLALLYRSQKHTESLSELKKQYQEQIMLLQGDLTDPGIAQEAAKHTRERYKRIDALVNPVGGWLGGKRVHEHTFEDLENMLRMDLKPTFNIMKAVLSVFVEQRYGKIINFSSLVAHEDGENNAIYGASKSAVSRLSEISASEYGSDGVQVYQIAPSTLDTEGNRAAMPGVDTGSWVSLESVGDAVKFLLQSGEELNGTTLKLSGTS